MRKALVIGIDYYDSGQCLCGCANDASGVKTLLQRNADNTVNFDVISYIARTSSDRVTRTQLRDRIEELFRDKAEIALLYFAGHGFIDATGGFILASDSSNGNEGVSMHDLITFANEGTADNRVIILDSCHSGILGSSSRSSTSAELTEGLTILTASAADQYASERNGSGVFTTLLMDALGGAACNLLGQITPGSVYAHIDQSLGGWAQRPIFKTNVRRFVSLRNVKPPIELAHLQRLTEFFPTSGFDFPLDPTFEPERGPSEQHLPPPIPENTDIFDILQKFNKVNLLVPVGAPHMWHAAVQSKSCKLTVLGEHYRRLVADGLI